MARRRHVNYLLIGGGLSASRAVQAIRRRDRRGSIALVGEETWWPYDRPPLSKGMLLGEIAPNEVATEKRWYYIKHRVRLYRGTRVERLDLETSPARALLSDDSVLTFDRALIATGGAPRKLDILGADHPGVHLLRTIDDSLALAESMKSSRRAVVIGGGFIGLEVAAFMRKAGLEVTLAELQEDVWGGFAPQELRTYLRDGLEQSGVRFLLGEQVSRIDGSSSVAGVRTSAGDELRSELVCIAVGIEPNDSLASDAGLATDGGIVVDERMQTSDPRVYAAGDVAVYTDPYSERQRRVEHYCSAEYGGLLAGTNMAGGEDRWDMVPYVWSDVGDRTVEIYGDESAWNELVVRELDPRIMILGLRENRVVCSFSVNAQPAELSAAQLLIRSRTDVALIRDRLADGTAPLASTVQQALSGR